MSLYVDIEKNFGSFVLKTKFEVTRGVLGILGASGCGKSMTLKCIAGIVKPDRGKIILNDRVLFDSEKKINLRPQDRHVGLLFQSYALFPNMTVRQNLRTGLKRVEKNKAKQDRLIEEMVRKLNLEGLENHKPSALSGGQQQRTALGRILLSNPDILLLDEPFSALDDYLKWNVELELMDILREFGGITLFVSHNREEIYRVCDHVCVMHNGSSDPSTSVHDMFPQPHSYAAALLSGCKNYSRAHMEADGRLIAEDWGTEITYDHSVPIGSIAYAGVRSHFINLRRPDEKDPAENVIPCRILKVIDDVFSTVILVRPQNAPQNAPGDNQTGRIRIEVTKETWQAYLKNCPDPDRLLISIDPKDILLLEK